MDIPEGNKVIRSIQTWNLLYLLASTKDGPNSISSKYAHISKRIQKLQSGQFSFFKNFKKNDEDPVQLYSSSILKVPLVSLK